MTPNWKDPDPWEQRAARADAEANAAPLLSNDQLPEPLRGILPAKLLERVKGKAARWKLKIQTGEAPHQPTEAERQIAALLRSRQPTAATVRRAIAETTAAMLLGEMTPAAAKVALYALQVLVSTHRKEPKK